MQDELLRGISQDHRFIVSVISVLTEMTDEYDAHGFAMQDEFHDAISASGPCTISEIRKSLLECLQTQRKAGRGTHQLGPVKPEKSGFR
jgi:hypothetical protein